MSTADKFRYKLKTANVVEKLIGINVLCFILFYLAKTIAFLFQWPQIFSWNGLFSQKSPGNIFLSHGRLSLIHFCIPGSGIYLVICLFYIMPVLISLPIIRPKSCSPFTF